MSRTSRSPSAAASILHADLDAFYASVEQRDDPSLRGRPIMVGGGVVLAASYPAKARGVRTAMSGRAAKALCPSLVVVAPRMDAYSQASKEVFAIFDDTTPWVEGLSIDEAFLDVGGLARVSGTPAEIASRLRSRVKSEVGLDISVGVARTKFLAKVASASAKPDGLLVVEPHAELDFLHPLPVERLWGVGKVTAAKLHAAGLMTVGQVAEQDLDTLVGLLGRGQGSKLHHLSLNDDSRRVTTGVRRRSIGSQRSLGSRHDHGHAELETILGELVDRVTRRLRDRRSLASTVVLRVRFGDHQTVTRSRSLSPASNSTELVTELSRRLLGSLRAEITRRGISLIGISLAKLSDAHAIQQQLAFADTSEVDRTLDEIKRRFGGQAVSRAATLSLRPHLEVPLLADPRDDSR